MLYILTQILFDFLPLRRSRNKNSEPSSREWPISLKRIALDRFQFFFYRRQFPVRNVRLQHRCGCCTSHEDFLIFLLTFIVAENISKTLLDFGRLHETQLAIFA